MSQQTKRILKRMRTQMKYSALTTMTMWLLKSNNLYALSEVTAKSAQIKRQKNFGIIALRLSILLRELSKDSSYEDITRFVFGYFRNNLQEVLRQKFHRFKNHNSLMLIDAAKKLNFKDIEVFEEVCKTNFRDPALIRQIIKGLYEPNGNGAYDREQLKSMQKLITIFSTYGVNRSNNACQKKQLQQIDQIDSFGLIKANTFIQHNKNNKPESENKNQAKEQDTTMKKVDSEFSPIIINQTDFTLESIFENLNCNFSDSFIL